MLFNGVKDIWNYKKLKAFGTALMMLGSFGMDAESFRTPFFSEVYAVCPLGKHSVLPWDKNKKEKNAETPLTEESFQNNVFSEELLRSATVRVINAHSPQNGNGGFTDMGSGSCIENEDGKLFVITAAHVFGSGVGRVTIRNIQGETTEAKIVFMDKNWDIALALPERRLSVSILKFSNQIPTQKTRSYIAGYGSDDRFNITTGFVIGYSMMTRQGTYETLRTAGPVRKGDSGGPVVNDRNEIIGVVWGTDGQASYATWNGRIKKLLASEKSLRFGNLVLKDTLPGDDSQNTLDEDESSSNEIADSIPELQPVCPKKKGEKKKEKKSENKAKEKSLEDPSEDQTPPKTRIPPPASTPNKFQNEKIAGPYERVPPSPKENFDETESKIQEIRNECQTIVLTVTSFPLTGWGIWFLWQRLKRRRFRKKNARNQGESAQKEEAVSAKSLSIIDQNNEYAQELNDLYDLNGRNSVADATCGRLYDLELEGAEQSSDSKIANYASALRRKIKEELVRIHSGTSVPASGSK